MKLNLGCGRSVLPDWINVDSGVHPGLDVLIDLDRLRRCATPAALVRLPHGAKIERAEDWLQKPFCYINCMDWNYLPFQNDSVDEVLLSHVVEHLKNPLGLFDDLHRVCRDGAIVTVRVPYGSSDDAWEDPTHVRGMFLNSFGYFSQPFYWRADYGYSGDFEVEQIELHIAREVLTDRVGMPSESVVLLEEPHAEMAIGGHAVRMRRILDVVHRERNIVSEMVARLRAIKPAREPRRELQVRPPIKIVVL
jgi:predicted SAM-dependent methyltransferase